MTALTKQELADALDVALLERDTARNVAAALVEQQAMVEAALVEARQWIFRDQPKRSLETLTAVLDTLGVDYPR